MISTVSDTNIFADLGATNAVPVEQQEQINDLKPKDLRLKASYLQARYVDERINDPEIRQWMEDRRLGVGASEIAVLFNLSPWQNLYELWREKVYG